jgi:hypothetical protein
MRGDRCTPNTPPHPSSTCEGLCQLEGLPQVVLGPLPRMNNEQVTQMTRGFRKAPKACQLLLQQQQLRQRTNTRPLRYK